jgi:hypothetical protein
VLQYSINKLKILLGFVGQQWEQQIVAELDSALNKWIDDVPDHRMYLSLNFVIAAAQMYNLKSDGIQIWTLMTFSCSRIPSIRVTIMCRFSSTAHSFHHPENHPLCLSLPWRSAQMLLDLVATSWMYIDVDLVCRCLFRRCVKVF